jgi:phosphoglycerate dehydrogenase-like enzyme
LAPKPRDQQIDPQGTASAELLDRRGASVEPTDWIATTARLDEMLRAADVFVVCAALTTETAGLIGA